MGWSGLVIAAAVLVAASGFGLFRHTRDGKVRMTRTAGRAGTAGRVGTVRSAGRVRPARSAEFDLSGLGVRAGRVTLLQFSSAFCAPCRATRVLCAQVAQENPHTDHVEVDAESHLEPVRALNIWRTPTVLVVDAAGRIAGRAQGVPTLAQLRTAVRAVTLEAAND